MCQLQDNIKFSGDLLDYPNFYSLIMQYNPTINIKQVLKGYKEFNVKMKEEGGK